MHCDWALDEGDLAKASDARKGFMKLVSGQAGAAQLSRAELAFGELVTNAVRYGRSPITVRVVTLGSTIEIAVEDAGNGFDLEERLEAEPTTTGGRGLQIVSRIVDRLEVKRTPADRWRVVVTLHVPDLVGASPV